MTRPIHDISWLRILIRGLAWAVLLIAVLAFTAEALDRAFLRPHGKYGRSVRDFQQAKDRIETLYLGQSDIGEAILGAMLPEQEFNFAWGFETPIGTYHKLKTYIDALPRLKRVVYSVPLCCFGSTRSDQIRTEHYIYYIHGRDVWDLFRLKGPNVFRQEAISWVSCFENQSLQTLDLRIRKAREVFLRKPAGDPPSSPNRKMDTALESVPPPKPWDVENETRAVMDAHWKNPDAFDGDLLLYFKKLLELAAQKNVQVVLLTCPVHERYLERSAAYVSMDELKQRVLDLPEISALYVRHLNYLDLYARQDEYFKDPVHLSRAGAEMFTRRIRQELAALSSDFEATDPAAR